MGLLAASPASAQGRYLSINWEDSHVRTINYRFDGDRYRNRGSLNRVAWMVNPYGRGVMSPGQKVALNVVVWQAACGDRFEYVNGLSPVASSFYNRDDAGDDHAARLRPRRVRLLRFPSAQVG